MSTLKENVLKSVNKHIIDREEERLRKKKNNGANPVVFLTDSAVGPFLEVKSALELAQN